MELLKRFAILTLAAGMILSLLPEGSVRRTASMAAGLMMLLFWAEGISALLESALLFSVPDAPLTPLTSTGSDVTQAAATAAQRLQHLLEDAQ